MKNLISNVLFKFPSKQYGCDILLIRQISKFIQIGWI